MNKKLLAIAVASALAAPMAANANDNIIYGQMHYSWDFIDTNDANNDASDDATGVSRASRLGFKGSEDLGDGMKAVYQIEQQVDEATMGSRNTFVGLAGGFGTLVMGRHDTPYKISTGSLDIFSDTIADYNAVIGAYNGGVNFDERASQTVAYITPDFSGFHAAIARVSVKRNENAAGAAETEAWSLAGIYKNGPLFVSLAYETVDDGSVFLNTAAAGNVGAATTAVTDDESDAWKLGLGYSFGDGKIGFIYEDKEREAANSDVKSWLVNYAHKFGNNTFKIAYGVNDDLGNTPNSGSDMMAVGLDHSFSKRTSVYAIYATQDNDTGASYDLVGANAAAAGRDVDAFSFGIVHKF
ncbi:MAG: porin [Chromatiales bacterium]|nr:porin [Chromatiales bacterium]